MIGFCVTFFGSLNFDSVCRGAVDSMATRLKQNVGKRVFQSQWTENYILKSSTPFFIEESGKNRFAVEVDLPVALWLFYNNWFIESKHN